MIQETNRRTETGRRNDDSDLLDDDRPETPDQQGRSGGSIERAVGTRDERKRLDDPDTTTGVDKADERDDIKPNDTTGTT